MVVGQEICCMAKLSRDEPRGLFVGTLITSPSDQVQERTLASLSV